MAKKISAELSHDTSLDSDPDNDTPEPPQKEPHKPVTAPGKRTRVYNTRSALQPITKTSAFS